MKNTTHFLTVIKALCEVVERDEMSILCQSYEIEQLKQSVLELEEKLKQREEMVVWKNEKV